MSAGEGGREESGKGLTSKGVAGEAASSSLVGSVKYHIPPEWRRPRRLVLVATLVAAVIALIVATRPSTPRHPAPGMTVFPIGSQLVLRFVHSTGSVRVRAGPGGQVSITEHRSGFTDAIHTRYWQQGNVITVTVSIENGLPTATWVDFDVAVPQQVTAKVEVAAGTLTATGLAGDFVLHDTNGSIWANNVSGAIVLQTVSGSINTNKVSGQVRAVTGNGTITTTSTHLDGHSVMQAQNGTINFHGSLKPGSRAMFSNTNGAIGVTLPRDSSVLVNARTAHGSTSYRLGRGVPARLRIHTIDGSINLNR